MNTVKWGIIGCGDVCNIKSGPAFYKIQHSELIAVMRRNEEKIKDFAQKHHLKKYYTNAELLINDPEINAIYIATPPDAHKMYTIQALKAGKPVYVEKPMAVNYEECAQMINAARSSGIKLFTAYYRRALPYFLKIKELLDNKRIGKIQTVNIQYYRSASESDKIYEKQSWRVRKDIAGGGYFYDMAPHTLDILDFLIGKITDTKAYISNKGGFYKVEDTISAIFHFDNGVTGTGQWCYVSSPSGEKDLVEITGEKGKIIFNTFDFKPIQLITSDGYKEFITEQPEHIQQPLIQTIVNELRGIGQCPSTGESGARTSWVIDKMFGKI